MKRREQACYRWAENDHFSPHNTASETVIADSERYKEKSNSPFVVSANGKPVFVRCYRRSFELLLKKLKIPHKGFHSLLHISFHYSSFRWYKIYFYFIKISSNICCLEIFIIQRKNRGKLLGKNLNKNSISFASAPYTMRYFLRLMPCTIFFTILSLFDINAEISLFLEISSFCWRIDLFW